VLFRSFFILF